MAVHAAGESGPSYPGTVAVVLGVADQAALLEIHEQLDAGSEATPYLFIESDGEYAGQAMAIGYLLPQGKSGLLSHLRLWRPKT